jgi:hypothetical protein
MIHLPDNFPGRTQAPKFHLGDRVQFIPMPAEDHGIVIGVQYAPAEHLQDWTWCYTLWLDPHSPSYEWTYQDSAWEDDLALYTPEPGAKP